MTIKRLFLLGIALITPWHAALAQQQAADIGSVAPHRAIYKVALDKVKQGTGIHDVAGTMLFDVADSCDGWAVQQHMQLRFAFPEGDMSEVSSDMVTWEAKDGKSFRFNVKRVCDGKEDENYKGHATLAAQGGKAHYSFPTDKADIDIPADAVFPMAHTALILQNAAKGEKLFTRRVLDGADENGAADVSAFIGALLDAKAEAALDESVRKMPLVAGHKAWPARLAFYTQKENNGEPDYEMDITLQDNGIARAMTIDYGAFSVRATLASLAAGDPVDCSGGAAAVK